MVIKEILVVVVGLMRLGDGVGTSPISQNCEKLIQSYLGIQLPFSSTQNLSVNSSSITKQQLSALAQYNCLINMHPFYKWAQNTTHIHVKIEFRLSAQTTPCEYVLYSNKSLRHDSFQVEVLCLHTQYYLINYHLYVKTFKSMNYHHLEWNVVPNKYVVLEVMKAPVPYIWKYLHSPETVPKKKPKIWWEMLKKFEEDMGMLVDKMDIGESDYQVSTNVRENSHKRTQPDQIYQDIQFYCYQGSPQYLASWL